MEPFGESRADLRAAAHAMWQTEAMTGASSGQEISLFHPYFPGAEERMKQHRELLDREKTLGPEHQEKLKRARREHIAKMKAEKAARGQ